MKSKLLLFFHFKTGIDIDLAADVLDTTRVVTFQVPNNAAVQIYDYKSKKSRVVFGPDLVMLEPNEEFTRMSLSGAKPKKANLIQCLALLLGPDFCSDIIIVETSDHARLQLQLSYNWHFDIEGKKADQVVAIFFDNSRFVIINKIYFLLVCLFFYSFKMIRMRQQNCFVFRILLETCARRLHHEFEELYHL